MKEIENYIPRKSEVLDSVGRFIRVYDPHLRCENGSFVRCEQGTISEFGRVVRQLGNQRFDIDLLGARFGIDEIKVSLLADSFSIKIESTSMEKVRWTEGEALKHLPFSNVDPILLGSTPIDSIAPLKRGATHLVFYDESYPMVTSDFVNSVTKLFESSAIYTNFDEVLEGLPSEILFEDLDQQALDVFAEFTRGSDLVWLDCRYLPEFSNRLVQFEKERNPTSTVIAFVKTDANVFPIIESLNFGNIEALWVIDEEGRLDPTRTRTQILNGDEKRAQIMLAIHNYQEAKFQADLLGEPFEEELPFPEILEPIF